MNFPEAFRIAMRALAANKARSALTMLGVIIGVAAVILLVAIGTGVQGEITGQIEGLGSNLLFIVPGQYSGGMGGDQAPPARRLTLEDADLIARKVEGLSAVVPVLQGGATIKAGNRSMRVVVAAGNEQGTEVFASTLAGGRHYRRSEVQVAARVCALGSRVAETLFPGKDPVGQRVSINGQRFTVIGHYESLGGGLSGDQDSQVYIPVTTAQRLFGVNFINTIVVKAATAEDVERVKAEIRRVLTPRYGEEFTVFTQEQTLGLLSDLLGTLTYMLAGIAAISLLVGGIGIMNIMLVSVTERTREIGIRKAVGARTYDILSQFVIEAVALSVLGGTIGIALGWSGAVAMARFTPVPTDVTPWAVALAFFFSAGVGVFFGVYPAWKASRLDPIVALRYE
ncbi:ABC transporter permease [Coriobacteriia bacterium Es71-Z0120]|uniref:ABC transporter permease n=1 Tax=Parvivirga hydrogeniphila TaxID=2939460 RepID=UPI002260E6CF|nr:ABC transporter permease [Parvivirga hydrogeniphila]MCL4078200.1 ABC transporter permease [Parvivirga hydrogeniphila]